MKSLRIDHRTRYRYAQPVRLGEHRLMLRPRDSHDLRLIEATLTLSPPGMVRWAYDVFGNSVAFVAFEQPTTELVIESSLVLERYQSLPGQALLDPRAATYPFVYSNDDRVDLGPLFTRQHPDRGELAQWLAPLVGEAGAGQPTLALLDRLNQAIKAGFSYAVRTLEGTQTPAETLAFGAGSCRDFAVFMAEAARELGLAARFVTGYLYDPALDSRAVEPGAAITGAGATHAWAEVYLPGSGWIDYDPTNALVGSEHLIRVAVVREPGQAAPVKGSFTGAINDFQQLEVDVRVTTLDPLASAPASVAA